MLLLFKQLFKKKESKVLRKKKPPRHITPLQLQIVIGIVLAIVIALLLTSVYYVSHIASMQITSVQVIGGETIPRADIEGVVNTALTGAYYKLVPKRFNVVYPKETVIESIKKNNRIKNVQVEIQNGQTLIVVFDEYTPYALWCKEVHSTECLFMDTHGYAFAEAPELEGSAFIRYVEEGHEPLVKTHAYPEEYIQQTETFIEELKNTLNLYVTQVIKKGQYDIEYQVSGGGILKVSARMSSKDTFENLVTLLHSKEFTHFDITSFKYIDLRFGDKVFVHDGTTKTVSSTASTPEKASR